MFLQQIPVLYMGASFQDFEADFSKKASLKILIQADYDSLPDLFSDY